MLTKLFWMVLSFFTKRFKSSKKKLKLKINPLWLAVFIAICAVAIQTYRAEAYRREAARLELEKTLMVSQDVVDQLTQENTNLATSITARAAEISQLRQDLETFTISRDVIRETAEEDVNAMDLVTVSGTLHDLDLKHSLVRECRILGS